MSSTQKVDRNLQSDFKFSKQQTAEEIYREALKPNCIGGLRGLDEAVEENLHLIKPYYDQASETVNDFFNRLRAVSLLVYGFRNPKLMDDDRLAENLDVVFDCFKLSAKGSERIASLNRQEQFFEYFDKDLAPWINFLQRTPTEYFKILVLKLGIRSADDLDLLIRPFSRSYSDQGQRYFEQSLTESLSRLGLAVVELTLGMRQASSISEFAQLLKSNEFYEIGTTLKELPADNLRFIVESGGFADLNHARYYLGERDSAVRSNLKKVNIQKVLEFAKQIGVAERDATDYVRDLISATHLEAAEPYISSLLESRSLEGTSRLLGPLIVEQFYNHDYITQNLFCISELLSRGRLKSDSEVQELDLLIKRFQGFATPRLAELIFDATDRGSKEKVFKEYQELQRQVLGSEPIEVKDIKLTAEVICIAYRPTNFSIAEIERLISERIVCDLSSQLDRLVVRKEGYPMSFKRIRQSQTEEFDLKKLSALDSIVTRPYDPAVILEVQGWLQCLSYKPQDLEKRSLLLAAIIQSLKDPRVKTYCDNYRKADRSRANFSQDRIEVLLELLSIIPKEPEFESKIHELLSENAEFYKKFVDQIESYQWKSRKGKFKQFQIEDKGRIESLISRLEQGASEGIVATLYEISDSIISSDKKASIPKLGTDDAIAELRRIKRQFFLAIDPALSIEDFTLKTLTQLLQSEAQQCVSQLKKELKKVKAVVTEETVEVIAFISKNIGSFFAKAGAEICTASNIPMWNESRHFHLNVARNDQIIMNNMLYFEEGPELSPYLIVRGVNPRRDSMSEFDRRSMALELSRVLKVIAADNRRESIFIPEQTAWHALSNRDGMAAEMLEISRHESNRTIKDDPAAVVQIETDKFSYTTLPDEGMRNPVKSEPIKLLLLAKMTG